MFSKNQIIIPEIGEIPSFSKKNMALHDWKDGILIRTPNWLGDVVMTFPAMLQLKRMLPAQCGLFVVCPKGLAPLLKTLDIVDHVIPLENAHSFPTRSEWGSIRNLHAGAGILFNNSFRDALALKLAGIPALFGASARFRSILLNRSFVFPKRRDFILNKPHHAAKYLSIAYAIGAPEWDGTMPELRVFAEPEITSDEITKLLADNKLMILAAGAAYGDAKRWEASGFRDVAHWWIERGGTVAAVGSNAERTIAQQVIQDLPQEKAFCLAGATRMEDLILLLKNAKICIANDSGVMHLAAVLGTKGVAPFGPTDPAATSPLSKNWRLIFEKLPCSPCFKRDCPNGTKKCFEAVTPEKVIRTVQELLQFSR